MTLNFIASFNMMCHHQNFTKIDTMREILESDRATDRIGVDEGDGALILPQILRNLFGIGW